MLLAVILNIKSSFSFSNFEYVNENEFVSLFKYKLVNFS